MIQRHIGRAVPYLDTDMFIIVKDGWTNNDVIIPDELVGMVVINEFFYWYTYIR